MSAFNPVRIAEELADARRRAEALVAGLDAGQLNMRPAPEKWSVAECLAHLNVTAATVQRLMEKAIERGRREKKFGTGPFSLGARGRLLIWIAEPPPKFRIPAPRSVRPASAAADPGQVLKDFMRAQDEWERLMREQEGLDTQKIKIGRWNSPFRARLAAAVPWMLAHQRRHLLQAEKVKQAISS
jgi:DinB superfamily